MPVGVLFLAVAGWIPLPLSVKPAGYLGDGERLASARRDTHSEDPDALFALCTATGLETDYPALIEPRRLLNLPSPMLT